MAEYEWETAFLQEGFSCVFGSTSSIWSCMSKEQDYQFVNYLFHQNTLYFLWSKALTFVFLFFNFWFFFFYFKGLGFLKTYIKKLWQI